MAEKEKSKKADPKTREYGKDQVWMVGKCQVDECGKVAPLAKVAPRVKVMSAGGEVQICIACYDAHFKGCKIVNKHREQPLMFKQGETRRVV